MVSLFVNLKNMKMVLEKKKNKNLIFYNWIFIFRMSLTIEQIDQQVYEQVPKIDKRRNLKEYFELSSIYLKSGGEFKKKGDFETSYANLKGYLILIEEYIPSHPEFKKFQNEYNFNKNKISALVKEIELLKKDLPKEPEINLEEEIEQNEEGSNSDLISNVIESELVKGAVTTTFNKTIGNKEFQKKVGNKISEAAQDKETQKKVAKGITVVGKEALKNSKVIGKGIFETAKYTVQEYQKEQE